MFCLIHVLFVLQILQCLGQDDDDLIVETAYGAIRGGLASNTRFFTSIPYAAPPIDELRFVDPIEPLNWNDEILNTTNNPPGCPQFCGGIYCPTHQSEDCLMLNVFTPYPISNNSKLSVNVFIHGGAWVFGFSAPYTIFNATNFVLNTNSIVVTINYRLGVFGLFYHPDYPQQLSGNYGVKDIIFALKWIQENIESFGGDPLKVTLFGNSVGSGTIAILSTMNNDEINNLFQSAVITSNPFFGAPIRTKNNWGRIPNLILEHAQCSNVDSDIDNDGDNILQCLRNQNYTILLDAMQYASQEVKYDDDQLLWLAVQWTPTIGTGFINEQPLNAFNKGNFNKNISYLIGISSFETLGLTFATFNDLEKDYEAFQIYLQKVLGTNNADKILEFYGTPINIQDVTYPPYAANITTYGRYICPAFNVALAIDKYIDKPNQLYYFHYNHINSFSSNIFPSIWLPYCAESGVCHNAEVSIIFNSPNMEYYNNITNDEFILSYSIQNYINNLIKTTNNTDYFLWDSFDSINQRTMVFDNGTSMNIIEGIDSNQCVLWNELDYNWLPTISDDTIDDDLLPRNIIIFLVVTSIIFLIFIIFTGIWCFRKKHHIENIYDQL